MRFQKSEMSEYFPFEIAFEILLRLPVKSLVRFRCVSKSWYSLITNSDFISLHTKITINNNSTTKLLVRYYSLTEKMEKYAVYCDDASFSEDRKIESPLFPNLYLCFYIGSVNGLICLSAGFSSIILWNPAIDKYLTYPIQHSNDTIGTLVHIVLGFGFDYECYDYKVVKFGYYSGNDVNTLVSNRVYVFELSTNAWRRISAVPPSCRNSHSMPQVFANGVVHWIVDRGTENHVRKWIITFDMSEEVFGEMELPDGIDEGLNGDLLVFGDSLCYVYNQHHDEWNTCYIWVMKEYGNAESWTKQFAIDIHGQVRYTLGLRNNGKIIQVTSDGELVSYDPVSQMIHSPGIRGCWPTMRVDTYMETLALLNKPDEQESQHNYLLNEHVSVLGTG